MQASSLPRGLDRRCRVTSDPQATKGAKKRNIQKRCYRLIGGITNRWLLYIRQGFWFSSIGIGPKVRTVVF